MVRKTATHRSTFFVSNVHCSSCVSYITQVLSAIIGVADINVSIFTHEVHVLHTYETDPVLIARTLIHAAFEVHHVTTRDEAGSLVLDYAMDNRFSHDSAILSTSPSSAGLRDHQRHLDNCMACRKEELEQSLTPSSEEKSHQSIVAARKPSTVDSVSRTEQSQEQPGRFFARISIAGMSCASCANSITEAIQQLDFIEDVTVTLLSNSATVTYFGLESKAAEIVEHIEDIGFEAILDDVDSLGIAPPESSQQTFVAEIAIGGMTCGSCSGAVTQGLNKLPFVTEAIVNLLSHSAQVQLQSRDDVPLVLEKIEDLGYDASLVSIIPRTAASEKPVVEQRTVSFRIDGMFCHHCPEKVFSSLNDLREVEYDDMLSVKYPVIKVKYTPHTPSLTVRSILDKIENAHSAFKATVYHPPSVEDRSREMQRHERRRLLSRFLFVLLVAIPEFIIGIVFMSIVSKDNSIRQYLEESMWSGSVSRIEWALFIMTTPVMFYGTDIFHVRAAKEIISLWRPGSRVPVLRRFYRFGSMNLLISAGTMVAYISSLGILIADAVATNHSGMHSSNYFDTVVFLTLFILAGRYMEAYSKARAGDAVASLGKLRPSEALLVTNTSGESEVQRVNVDLLEVGDLIRVPHGASPPADGIISGTGLYQFDESSLTGESRPVSKSSGDQVYTGSVNVGQPVEFNITAIGGSSMLDQIINVVREGQSKRAPLERVADVLVAHFVPAITLIAVLTFAIWVALGVSGTLPTDYLDTNRGGWPFWSLEFAIAVFVVACPCGLALAAPTALFVGGGLAARYGILVKGGGEAFQEASRLNAIVFDKTGTLTEGGSLRVTDHEMLVADSTQLQVAWALARRLEESSNHPIARAISEFCINQSVATIIASEIEEKSGQGMQGTFTVSVPDPSGSTTNRQFEAAIGNQRLYQSISSPNHDHYYLSNLLSKYQTAGKSTAILSLRESSGTDPEKPASEQQPYFIPAIVFAVSDTIRADAAKVISKLQQRKINVFMCTGDNETTAHAVADMVGIPRANVLANTLPAGKADFVRQIQTGGQSQEQHGPNTTSDTSKASSSPSSRPIVAFVGDGVNDSPALAAADVSIAMASGSDVAINSASFILLNSELDTILQLALLSRRVINRIRMNFGWAVVYNLCLVPVAAGVFYPIVSGHKMQMAANGGEMALVDTHWRLSPVWAALAMALSSISVVCSSLALAVQKRTFVRAWGWFMGKLGLSG
ncbi:E1-E2 ATPase-domain-containing protein [Aspergillus heterothallicus]